MSLKNPKAVAYAATLGILMASTKVIVVFDEHEERRRIPTESDAMSTTAH